MIGSGFEVHDELSVATEAWLNVEIHNSSPAKFANMIASLSSFQNKHRSFPSAPAKCYLIALPLPLPSSIDN